MPGGYRDGAGGVILGGSLSGVLDIARAEVEHSLEQYAFDPGHPVELVMPRFGADSALLGAAELAFAGLLEDPFLVLAHG